MKTFFLELHKMRLLLILCLTLSFNIAQATHILALDAYITCTAKTSSTIELRLKLFQLRDANISSVPFDTKLEIGVYDPISKNLIKTFTINQVYESEYAPSMQGFKLFRSNLEGNVSLPISQNGYLIFFGRCCMRNSQNLVADAGTGILIEVPASLEVGEYTLKRDQFGFLVGQRNKPINFTYPWQSELYDSVSFDSEHYFLYGAAAEPIVKLENALNPLSIGSYTNGGKPGDPFGKYGTFTRQNDSVYTIEITQNGLYFYPITSVAFLAGKQYEMTQLLPLFIQDSVPAVFDLELLSFDNGIAQFYGYSQGWPDSATLYFQRSEDNLPYSFTTLTSTSSEGFALPFTDSTQEQSKRYAYRLLRTGSGSNIISDTIVLQNNVGLAKLKQIRSLKIFPNPVNSQLTMEGGTIGRYQIIDLQGKVWLEGIKSTEIETLSIYRLKPGIYFLKIAGSTYRVVKSN